MNSDATFSRRTFLKGTAALGAMAALTGCASQEALKPSLAGEAGIASGEVQVRHNWCQMCGPAKTKCSTLCYVKDGKFTNVEGNPEAGNNYGVGSRSLCSKANAAVQVPYSPLRIMYPMKRTGEKGEGKFERITWEEALDIISTKLLETKEKYGPECFAALSPQEFAVQGTIAQRFLNVHGTPNYMHSSICMTQRTWGAQVTVGGKALNAVTPIGPGEMDKTKLYVNWGENLENSACNQGGPFKRVDNKQKNGMKIIDIRPMLDPLASKADVWVPVRPGTDCALALAILHVIIGEDLYDHDFCDNWVNGFDKLAEHVKQFPPSWASPITGVPEEQIYEVARMMGTIKPMGIGFGNGVGDQASDGTSTIQAICSIEAITGNMGIAGGGNKGKVLPPSLIKTKPFDRLSDRLPESEEDKANGWHPGASKLVAPEIPRWYQGPHSWHCGLTSAYFKGIMSVLTEKPYPIRCLLAQSTNPLSATRQPQKVVEALKKIEFYFVMDTTWNSSCNYADVVLPALTHYETSDQFNVKNMAGGTAIGINQGVIEPIGEGRSDWRFYCDLAVKMGYGEDFWNGDMDACLREQLDGSGIDLEELRAANKGIFVERTDGAKPTEPKYQDYEKMFASLPGGKVQCYNEWIGNKPNCDDTGTISPLPVYNGPAESIAGTPDIAEEYPLVISDVHAYRLCNHSYYVDVPYLRELQPYPWVKINPATAKQYGIADGDWVKIESPHGWVKMVARYLESIAPDVLMSRRGWWQPCEELDLPGYDHLDGGSEINVLYDAELANFDPFNSAMSKQTLVKISKLEEGN